MQRGARHLRAGLLFYLPLASLVMLLSHGANCGASQSAHPYHHLEFNL